MRSFCGAGQNGRGHPRRPTGSGGGWPWGHWGGAGVRVQALPALSLNSPTCEMGGCVDRMLSLPGGLAACVRPELPSPEKGRAVTALPAPIPWPPRPHRMRLLEPHLLCAQCCVCLQGAVPKDLEFSRSSAVFGKGLAVCHQVGSFPSLGRQLFQLLVLPPGLGGKGRR